jgi:hypothetical protein
MKDRVKEAFEKFIEAVQYMVIAENERKFPQLENPRIYTMPGRRYWRVVRESFGAKSAYCFVDKTNGDILMAATWKAPAKHARGNVLDENPLKAVTEYGAIYLR